MVKRTRSEGCCFRKCGALVRATPPRAEARLPVLGREGAVQPQSMRLHRASLCVIRQLLDEAVSANQVHVSLLSQELDRRGCVALAEEVHNHLDQLRTQRPKIGQTLVIRRGQGLAPRKDVQGDRGHVETKFGLPSEAGHCPSGVTLTSQSHRLVLSLFLNWCDEGSNACLVRHHPTVLIQRQFLLIESTPRIEVARPASVLLKWSSFSSPLAMRISR